MRKPHSKYGLLFVVLLLSTLACQKEVAPQLESGSPVFLISGSMNGSPVLFEAGNEDYFMFTSLKSDSTGVIAMGGLLLKDTTERKGGFFLNFRDPDHGSQNSTPMDSALSAGAHPLYHFTSETPHENLHEIDLQMVDSSSVVSQIWDLGNGDFSTDRRVSVIYDDREQLQYPVKFYSQSGNNCSDAITHYIDFTQNGDCKSTFSFTQTAAYGIDCQAQSIIGSISNVSWSLDGTIYGSGQNVQLSGLSPGNHEVCATVTFSDGCFHVTCRDIVVSATGQLEGINCQNDFSFEESVVYVYDSLQLGKSELIYYDENGRVYTSYYSQSASELEVISASSYGSDAWGRSTYAVRFRYTGELRTKDGSSIQVDQLEGNMAIATPE